MILMKCGLSTVLRLSLNVECRFVKDQGGYSCGSCRV